jgi:large-conductance mechanosensitive channel
MINILAQVSQSVVAQVVNFLVIVALFALPLLACSKILKWNRERNERLDQMSKDLKEIKESLAKKRD